MACKLVVMQRMGHLYLVRHAQASLGADDYDCLSALGQRQSQRLGQYWAHKGWQPDAVLMGTLQRHAQTWAAIVQGAGWQTPAPPLLWPGLNEYDSEAVIRAIHPGTLDKPTTPEAYRQHFRLLRDGLKQWMDGVVSPQGMPCYSDFVQGVRSALDHVRQHYSGNVLIVSSGGPISTAVGQILGTTGEAMIELNMRIRNTAITEFHFTPKRHSLLTFNTLPHLDAEEWADWVSYA